MAPLPITLFKRATSSPHSTSTPPPVHQVEPGAGTFDPRDINNRGIFALFALLGASLVLASIWFFFWAKNGGFHFREGDWEDYKSTVLRRKGPNGKTLSNATHSTELGGGSVVPEADRDHESFVETGGDGVVLQEQQQLKKKKNRKPRGKKNNADPDVRAYRHEKPAQVGGINREADGSYHTDFADSTEASSEIYSARPTTIPRSNSIISDSHFHSHSPRTHSPSRTHSRSNPNPNPTTPTRHHLLRNFYPTSSQASSSPTRPLHRPANTATTPTRSRRASPRKQPHPHHRAPSTNMSGSASYTEPLDFESRYTAVSSEAGETEDQRGTKAYFHPIPGLAGGSGGGGGGSGGMGNSGGHSRGGFRRGGGRGRRDSLSDSEGEGTMMS